MVTFGFANFISIKKRKLKEEDKTRQAKQPRSLRLKPLRMAEMSTSRGSGAGKCGWREEVEIL